MPDHQPARRAAEAAVGHERDRVTEAAADDRRRDREHLGHPWRTGRTLVSEDDDLARLYDPVVDRRLAGRFRVEHTRRTHVHRALVPGELYDRAVGCEVAAKDAQRATRLERMLDRRNHLAVRIGSGGRVLGERATVDGG